MNNKIVEHSITEKLFYLRVAIGNYKIAFQTPLSQEVIEGTRLAYHSLLAEYVSLPVEKVVLYKK